MEKLIIITPHLSTGGQPQYVLKKIELLKEVYDIYCIEYSFFSPQYVVQRNKIKKMLKNKFYSISEHSLNLLNIINDISPNIIWLEEISETFLNENEIKFLYSKNRTWKLLETTHTSNDLSIKKTHLPDKFILVSKFSESQYKGLGVDISIIDYPVDIKNKKTNLYKSKLGFDINKKHILCVGLFTPGKNQSYAFDVAKSLENENIIFHFVGNTAPNFSNYWGPLLTKKPKNCILHGEKENVDEFIQACDLFLFPSKFELNPLVIKEALQYNKLPILMFNLETYCGQYDNTDNISFLTGDVKKDSNLILQKMNSKEFKEKIIEDIETTSIKKSDIVQQININSHFVGNPFLEIIGNAEDEYNVKFFDGAELIHNTVLKNNMWTKLNRKYYTDWHVTITNSSGLTIYNRKLDLKNKRVYIALSSKSLGDTLAWIPYVEEFRKKHNCELIVSTFMNELFIETYPNIAFVEPGDTVDNLYAMYEIGWYYDNNGNIDLNRVPNNFRTQPLQKTAADILGLDFSEIKPRLKLKEGVKKEKKVGIAIHGTAQAKYWNCENGWQTVVDYLIDTGYEVILYSIEHDGYMGNYHPKGIKQFPKSPIQEVIHDLQSCEFFIGIGSGLSWLAWATELPVVLISGFSLDYTETIQNTYRVINKNICTGCFNSHKLDAGDWNWCPINKGTDKQFICTKNITPENVISKIKQINFDWGFFDLDPSFRDIVENEIFLERVYEKYFKIERGDIVIDIGASVGPFVKSIEDIDTSKIYAIEPSKAEFKTLCKNVSNDVICINKAIGPITESNVILGDVYGDDKSVDIISFKDLIKKYNIDKIDFMKIDCEGGEYDVFTKENLKYLKSIPKIAGEWHLSSLENKLKFKNFINNILPEFKSWKINSVDGFDITNNLYSDAFIEYYNEILIYIEN